MGAAVFEHIGYEFKPVVFSVVGIGHAGGLILRFGAVAGEACYFIVKRPLWVEGDDICVVFGIHSEDEVEFLKIFFFKLPGFSCGWDISFLESLAHSMIWWFSWVVIMCASGINVVGLC